MKTTKRYYSREARRESKRIKKSIFGVFKPKKRASGSFGSKNR